PFTDHRRTRSPPTVGAGSPPRNRICRVGSVTPVTYDPPPLAVDGGRAPARLLAPAAALDDAALSGRSLLPGWTRGHVLTHLARNADGAVNLLTWARTGVETPHYASREGCEAARVD